MPQYDFEVPRSRGITSDNNCPAPAGKAFCATDIIPHLLLCRVTSEAGTAEFETYFNSEINAVEIDVPEDVLSSIETIGVGPNIQRYMDWLTGQSETIVEVLSDYYTKQEVDDLIADVALSSLSDVYVDSIQDRDLVAWDSSNGRFENTSFISASAYNVTTQAGDYTASYGDLISSNNSAEVTIALPTAVGHTGESIVVKKISNNAFRVNIDGSGSETIDGDLTKSIDVQYTSITLVSDGSNWVII